MGQPDLLSYARARTHDVLTSHLAADSVRNIRQSQLLLLDLLGTYGPCTDSDLYDLLPPNTMSPSGQRSRRSELVNAGLVVDSGIRRLTKSGRKSIAWAVK